MLLRLKKPPVGCTLAFCELSHQSWRGIKPLQEVLSLRQVSGPLIYELKVAPPQVVSLRHYGCLSCSGTLGSFRIREGSFFIMSSFTSFFVRLLCMSVLKHILLKLPSWISVDDRTWLRHMHFGGMDEKYLRVFRGGSRTDPVVYTSTPTGTLLEESCS